MMEPSKKLPTTLESKEVFSGRVFTVTTDTVTEGGRTYARDVVHHPGSAVIVPVFDDGTVGFVRQYRHPALRYLLEVPAGKLNKGERPEAGAARELEEELGIVCANLLKLTEFYVSPGFCEEKMWIYLATGLTETAQRLDEDEIVEKVLLPFSSALEMIGSGELEDAKTIIGLLLAAPHVGLSMLEAKYPAV
jgi:ADP-ribose pyrophosphatase